jgi:hypothetical protein
MWTSLSEGILELFAEHARIFHGRELVALSKRYENRAQKQREWEEEHRKNIRVRVGQVAVSASACAHCGARVEKREGCAKTIHFGKCKRDIDGTITDARLIAC